MAGQPARDVDFLVVGDGALGLALGYRLLRGGARVAIVGPQGRPGGASLAAGAMLNAWGELTAGQMADPALRDRAALMLAALPLWDGLCAELAPYAPAPLAPSWGTYLIGAGRGGAVERGALAEIAAALAAAGTPPQAVPAAGLAWLRAPAEAVLRIPDGWIAPAPVLAAYEAAILALGGGLISAAVVEIAPDGAGWRARLNTGEAVQAGAVALANGAFAQMLVDALPDVACATPRLVAEAGAAFDVRFAGPAPDLVVRTAERGGVGGFHLVPQAAGDIYVGASAAVSLAPAAGDASAALAALRAMVEAATNPDLGHARWRPRAVGFRAIAADGFPLLGASHAPGLWFAAGMRRDGFTSSPFIARELAAAMLGRPSALPARFAPSRPLISYKRRAQAIAEAAEGRRPGVRQRLERFHDLHGFGDFGLHPALASLWTAHFADLDHPRG